MPKGSIEKAEKWVVLCEDLRKELLIDLEELAAQADQIKKKVILNINSEANSDGLLTHAQEEYEACLTVNVPQFIHLINADVRTWKIKLQKTQSESK